MARIFNWVSNWTGQCKFLGQRDKNSFIVPGQRDNGISSKSCHWTGRAGTVSENLGRDKGDRVLIFCYGTDWDRILTACPVSSRKIPGQPKEKSEKRVKNLIFLRKKEIIITFFNFGLFWTFFFPETSRDFCCCSCPRTKGQQDKEFVFVPE